MEYIKAFSGFSVDDMSKAKEFYSQKLGLTVDENAMGLNLKFSNGNDIFIYHKDNHEPATYTVLNFVVEDIDQTVDKLKSKDVKFEHYDMGGGAKTDEKGIMRGRAAQQGPDIAWFKDPAGNIISVLSGE